MPPTFVVAASSGIVGGLVGAGMAIWLGGSRVERDAEAALRTSSAPGPSSVAEMAPGGSDVALRRRLEAVERALNALQARGAARPGAAPAAGLEGQPAAASAAVGDPVFEAAVLDVLERAEEDRDSERSERREERARRRAEHWAAELTERLALAPRQATQLAEIRLQLAADLREQRSLAEARFAPRAERRALTVQLRERAEQRLKAALEPRQVALYDQLEGELKLVRPPDAD